MCCITLYRNGVMLYFDCIVLSFTVSRCIVQVEEEAAGACVHAAMGSIDGACAREDNEEIVGGSSVVASGDNEAEKNVETASGEIGNVVAVNSDDEGGVDGAPAVEILAGSRATVSGAEDNVAVVAEGVSARNPMPSPGADDSLAFEQEVGDAGVSFADEELLDTGEESNEAQPGGEVQVRPMGRGTVGDLVCRRRKVVSGWYHHPVS